MREYERTRLHFCLDPGRKSDQSHSICPVLSRTCPILSVARTSRVTALETCTLRGNRPGKPVFCGLYQEHSTEQVDNDGMSVLSMRDGWWTVLCNFSLILTIQLLPQLHNPPHSSQVETPFSNELRSCYSLKNLLHRFLTWKGTDLLLRALRRRRSQHYAPNTSLAAGLACGLSVTAGTCD